MALLTEDMRLAIAEQNRRTQKDAPSKKLRPAEIEIPAEALPLSQIQSGFSRDYNPFTILWIQDRRSTEK